MFQKLLAEIPDYREFLTAAELDDSSRRLAREYPESVSLFEMGRTREDRSLLCLQIGRGERNALLFGCPHPNEPIGAMLLEYLSRRLAEDAALREALGYTWYIVKAWDADGLVKNEGWLKGPFRIYSYTRHFFRPAGTAQVDWTFPVDYKRLHFHDVLPETQAMMELIDRIRPEFIYALHNAGFGGTYWYESEPTPAIYDTLHSIPGKYNIPLSLGAAESPANKSFAPAIYRCGGAREEYDYLEKYGGGDREELNRLRMGDNSASYAYMRYGSFTLLTELPYFYDPRVADTSPSDMTRLEVLRQSVKETEQINRDLRRILALSEPYMSADNPYRDAVRDFSQEAGSARAALNQAEADPAFQQAATQAEKLDQLVISKFYKAILYGMLVRANETELERTTTGETRAKCLQQGYEEASGGLKNITDYLESRLQYSVVPIRDLIAVQLESGLAVLGHLDNRRRGAACGSTDPDMEQPEGEEGRTSGKTRISV